MAAASLTIRIHFMMRGHRTEDTNHQVSACSALLQCCSNNCPDSSSSSGDTIHYGKIKRAPAQPSPAQPSPAQPSVSVFSPHVRLLLTCWQCPHPGRSTVTVIIIIITTFPRSVQPHHLQHRRHQALRPRIRRGQVRARGAGPAGMPHQVSLAPSP